MSEPIYRLPDYSAWLTPDNLAEEDRLWLACGYYTIYGELVRQHLGAGKSVVEFGCGAGLVPTTLPADVLYVGVDANPLCLALARKRNPPPHRSFAEADVRTVAVAEVDVSCAFAFLKHFALFEWADVVARVLAPGRRAVFTMPVSADGDYEDGTAYPHTRVTPETLARAVGAAGHVINETRDLPLGEQVVFTSRR